MGNASSKKMKKKKSRLNGKSRKFHPRLANSLSSSTLSGSHVHQQFWIVKMNARLPSGVIETLANEQCCKSYSWSVEQVLSAWVGIFSTLRLPFCFMSLHSSLFSVFLPSAILWIFMRTAQWFFTFNVEPGCGMWQERLCQDASLPWSPFKLQINFRNPQTINEWSESHGSSLFRFGRNTTWIKRRWNNI